MGGVFRYHCSECRVRAIQLLLEKLLRIPESDRVVSQAPLVLSPIQTAEGAALFDADMNDDVHENVRSGIEACLPRLWRYALVLCRNSSLAEDLVQATCVRALERQEQFRGGTNLRAWLFTILSSIWKNHLRAEKVRAGAGFEDPERVLVHDGESGFETNNMVRRVLSEIEGLPEAQRQTVLLVYAEGFTYREAAHILEVPIGTIMSRLAAARGSLAVLNKERGKPGKTEESDSR